MPLKAITYSSDTDEVEASRISAAHSRIGEPARSTGAGFRTSSATSAAKATSNPPSSRAVRRPSRSMPKETAESKVASAAPRPNTPSTRPRRPYGEVSDTNAAPTTNAELPVPAAAPATTAAGNESASPRPITEAPATRLTAGNITRTPYRSVSTPTGNRANAATSTGNPTAARYQPGVTPNRACRCGPRSIEALRFSPRPMVTRPSVIPARGTGVPEKVIATTPDPSRVPAHQSSRARRIQACTRTGVERCVADQDARTRNWATTACRSP